MLAQLENITGVQRAYANRSGLLFRITPSAAANPEKLSLQVRDTLAQRTRKPVRVTGNALAAALDKEEWREARRIGELSAIEFRTLALRRVAMFAEEEKLDQDTAARLARMAGSEWDRLAKEAAATRPVVTDWRSRCREFERAMMQRAGVLLTKDQLDRLEQALSAPP